MSYSYTYNTSPYTITSATTSATGYSLPTWSDAVNISSTVSNSTLSVKGNAEFEGDVKIKGKSIADSLDRIEERLAILHPNEELEEKWEQLRGLRKAYMDLEAEIKEKEQIWKILKK